MGPSVFSLLPDGALPGDGDPRIRIAVLPGDGDPRIRIAVLDGPVDTSHPCFDGARLAFPTGQPAFDPQSAAAIHGTHVASIVFGQRGSPVEGIAPAWSGLILPIFSGDSGDGLRCSQLDLARAIVTAVEHGAHIINISGGQLIEQCEPDTDLGMALAECERQGVLVVAAAGNDGCDCGHLPACVQTVLAVGAAGADGQPLATSNWGKFYAGNYVLASGEEIAGAVPGGGTAKKTGTSFAAPVASAHAARLLAKQIVAGGAADPLAVRRRLAGSRITAGGHFLPAGTPTIFNEPLSGKRGRIAMNPIEPNHPDAMPIAALAPSAGPQPAAPAVAGASESASHNIHASEVAPSCAEGNCSCGNAKGCGCGCGGAAKAAVDAPAMLVFALGQIGFDFVTEARRDSIAQFMAGKLPTDEKALLAHLKSKDGAEDAERIVWTVMLDQTPIYAIQPIGAFAASGYGKILEAFRQQSEDGISLFAVPGRIAGSIRLMSGETVPIIVPAARAILAWDVPDSVNSFIEKYAKSLKKDRSDQDKEDDEKRLEEMGRKLPDLLQNFRNLITRKYRNLGVTGRERALNFASTAAFRVFEVLSEVVNLDLVLDDITVFKSPACRPGWSAP